MNFLKLIVSHNLFLIYLQHTTRLKPPPIPPLAKDRVVASMPSIQPNTIEPFQIAEAFFTDVAQPYCLLRRTSECYITLSVGMTQHVDPLQPTLSTGQSHRGGGKFMWESAGTILFGIRILAPLRRTADNFN